MTRWHRHPAARFAALGTVLFVGERALDHGGPRPELSLTAGRVAQIRSDFAQQTGRPPSDDDERVLLERAVDEEILYHEARARGFDRHDPAIMYRLTEKMRFVEDTESGDVRPIDAELYRRAIELGFDRDDAIVRGILVQKMRLLLARQADRSEPSERELRAYYERHRERYARAPRVDLWQVFLRADPHAEGTRLAADTLLEQLDSDARPPADAVRLGDPFPSGAHLSSQSPDDLARLFGPAFAAAVFDLEAGGWRGPLPSPYGLHLVRIERRRPGRPAEFESVRSRVRAELRAERREAHLADAMRELRQKYAVRVVETGTVGPG